VGCRLNQAETEAALEEFSSRGWELVNFSSPADVYYVNTCTVTGRADRSSRQLIHRARRQNPHAIVIAAGCFARRAAEELVAGGEVDLILGNYEKMQPFLFLSADGRPSQPVVHISDEDNYELKPAVGTRIAGRTRAFLKVQDGCDHSCAYCAVTLARGMSRSVPLCEIRHILKKVKAAGFEEVVLTGVDLTAWGLELEDSPHDFIELVQEAASVDIPRIRLSSLEPWKIDPERIAQLAVISAWCPHLHLSLQSADQEVLKRMNRPIDMGRLQETISELILRRPEATIGADLIAGFPGESLEAFNRTLHFIDRAPLHHLHVFPFSKRPGTPAAEFGDQNPPEIIAWRAKQLREVGIASRRRHYQSFIGTQAELLIEMDGQTGYTRNYLRCKLDLKHAKPRSRIIVRIERLNDRENILHVKEKE